MCCARGRRPWTTQWDNALKHCLPCGTNMTMVGKQLHRSNETVGRGPEEHRFKEHGKGGGAPCFGGSDAASCMNELDGPGRTPL